MRIASDYWSWAIHVAQRRLPCVNEALIFTEMHRKIATLCWHEHYPTCVQPSISGAPWHAPLSRSRAIPRFHACISSVTTSSLLPLHTGISGNVVPFWWYSESREAVVTSVAMWSSVDVVTMVTLTHRWQLTLTSRTAFISMTTSPAGGSQIADRTVNAPRNCAYNATGNRRIIVGRLSSRHWCHAVNARHQLRPVARGGSTPHADGGGAGTAARIPNMIRDASAHMRRVRKWFAGRIIGWRGGVAAWRQSGRCYPHQLQAGTEAGVARSRVLTERRRRDHVLQMTRWLDAASARLSLKIRTVLYAVLQRGRAYTLHSKHCVMASGGERTHYTASIVLWPAWSSVHSTQQALCYGQRWRAYTLHSKHCVMVSAVARTHYTASIVLWPAVAS